MIDEDAPLTHDEQQLMQYVDGEMSPADRAAFEEQLRTHAELAAQVAEFRSLADMTRSMALAEPTDREMARFWESFYNRSEWQIGWLLVIGGLTVLGVFGVYELLISPLHVMIKIASLSVIAGCSILLWNTLRLKMRTTRFDRYRGVMR